MLIEITLPAFENLVASTAELYERRAERARVEARDCQALASALRRAVAQSDSEGLSIEAMRMVAAVCCVFGRLVGESEDELAAKLMAVLDASRCAGAAA